MIGRVSRKYAAALATDAELVVAAQRGSAEAFSRLVERNYTAVCSYACGLTGSLGQSEEIAHDALILAWRDLSQLREPMWFRSWIFGITRNVARRALRKERSALGLSLKSEHRGADVPCPDPTPLDRLITLEEERTLESALAKIPEIYRIPLVLFYREQKDLKAVARALRLSPTNVRQRLWKGRQRLAEEVLRLVESFLTRSIPSKELLAGVAAVIVARATSQAMAGPWATAARHGSRGGRPSASLKRAAAVTVPLVLCTLAYLIVVKKERPIDSLRAGISLEPRSASGEDRTPVLSFSVEASGEAGPDSSPPGSAGKAVTIFSLDFEDGLNSPWFAEGRVVPAPPGSSSRFAMMGAVAVIYPVEYEVFMGGKGFPWVTYSDSLVLSFDYWVGKDFVPLKDVPPYHGNAISVAIGTDITRGPPYRLWVQPTVFEGWGHAELALSKLGSVNGEPIAPMTAGDRIAQIIILGGWTGGKPFYIDNLKLVSAPNEGGAPTDR